MKLKRIWKIILGILIAFFILGAILMITYNYFIGAVDKKDTTDVIFTIKSGTSTQQIGEDLESAKLIHNKNVFLVYVRLSGINNLQASTYKLSRTMSMKEIINIISSGKGYNPNEITVTFKEGQNIKQIAEIIEKNTNNKYEDVINLLKDKKYLNEIISDYWFVSDKVKNKKLYYSLEGYLFPDTYQIDKTWSVKDIFKVMLDRMEKELNKYKTSIESAEYDIHELLTIASIIEKEGKEKDFKKISSVFHNRLAINMKLESCATTYYGMKLGFNGVGIATDEMKVNDNVYNTYKYSGLPIGPISAPGERAIQAAIEPIKSDNYYFLSDNQGVTYFFNSHNEHQQKKQELINKEKWYR